jgi:hypothetical protein
MPRDEINTAIASVREVQESLSRLRAELRTEAGEEALGKCIEAIESAEALTQSLVDSLRSQAAVPVEPANR